jgi:hypothetical protein
VTALPLSELEEKLRKEYSKTQAFYQYWRDENGRLRSGWVRHFCGNLRLRHEPDNGNDTENPFWMVYTDQIYSLAAQNRLTNTRFWSIEN